MDVAEDGGLRPGYKLKLNSYDLGVDIELYDALQRIRFERPEIAPSIRSPARKIASLLLQRKHAHVLGLSSHAWKVNFCQIHQRNAQRDRRLQRTLRPEISRRT